MRRLSPSAVFFLLPFFLMSGVALQSVGLYLCLVLAPLFYVFPITQAQKKLILLTALLLAGCYSLPIVTQSALALFDDPLRSCTIDPPLIKSCSMTLGTWLKSPVSFSFIGLALGWSWIAFRFGSTKRVSGSALLSADEGTVSLNDDETRFRAFASGLVCATIVFFAYGLIQHFTGFNGLSVSRILADEHRMSNGRYRIFVFYGHPLSLAGASLVWFSLAVVLFFSSVVTKRTVFGVRSAVWGLVAILQSLNVLMSGGRTALLVVGLFWTVFLLRLSWKMLSHQIIKVSWFQKRPRVSFFAVLASFVLIGVILISVGFGLGSGWNPRGLGGGTMGQGPLGDRPYFWQTYLALWRDSPWLGQGFFALSHGVRNAYYVREGFAALHDKFVAHNIFLEVLGISGVLGLLGYVLILVLLYLTLRAIVGFSQDRHLLMLGIFTAFIANLLHGFTQNTFFDSAVSACYLGLIGLLLVPSLKLKFPNKT